MESWGDMFFCKLKVHLNFQFKSAFYENAHWNNTCKLALNYISFQIREEHCSSDQTLALQCHLHCWIGVTDIEVEENSSGETNLKKCLELAADLQTLDLVADLQTLDLVIFAKIKALNQVETWASPFQCFKTF